MSISDKSNRSRSQSDNTSSHPSRATTSSATRFDRRTSTLSTSRFSASNNGVQSRDPLPEVSLRPSNLSPSYGATHIVRIVIDPATNLERYELRDRLGTRFTTDSRNVLKHVSAAELEDFDCRLAEERKKDEDEARRAALALRQPRKRPGRPPKASTLLLRAAQRNSNEQSQTPSRAGSNVNDAPTHNEHPTSQSQRRDGGEERGASGSRTRTTRSQSSSTDSLANADHKSIVALGKRSRSATDHSDAPSAGKRVMRSNGQTREDSAPPQVIDHAIRRAKGKARATIDEQDVQRLEEDRANGVRDDAAPGAEEDGNEEEEEEEEEYEVEKILDDFVDEDGEQYYIVKWYGYEELTEEPSAHLEEAREVVTEYWMKKMQAGD